MVWKIDGKTPITPFVIAKNNGAHELNSSHTEGSIPWDYPVTLDILEKNPNVALIKAVDRRGTTDGSPAYNRFMCYSAIEGKQIITTYQIYTFTGPVIVRAWKPEKIKLLEDIDMEHFDITPDRTPERIIARHLERITGKNTLVDGLRDMAEKTYFDMLWNINQFYGIYNGSVPELPTDEERAKAV